MKRQWIPLIAVVVIAGVLIYQNTTAKTAQQARQTEELPKIGFKAPSFTLPSFDDKTYAVPMKDGKPVVINFWASWCGPCRLEAPELVKLYDKYKGKLEIYAVNLTLQDTVPNAKAFVDEFGFTFPILLDRDEQNSVGNLYQVQAIPTTYFVNKEGVIIDKVMGVTDSQTLENKFRSLLK